MACQFEFFESWFQLKPFWTEVTPFKKHSPMDFDGCTEHLQMDPMLFYHENIKLG